MSFTFNATGYSTLGLLMMHEGIQNAHKADREAPVDQTKVYGVYEYADWKIQSDEIESELTSRQCKFDAIPWDGYCRG
jgi:hypothetical protein